MKMNLSRVSRFPIVNVGKSLFLSSLPLVFVACSAQDQVEIETQRKVTRSYGQAQVGATSADRFGPRKTAANHNPSTHETQPSDDAVDPNAAPLAWDVPEGWDSLAPTSMRLANLVPAGNPDSECTLTLLGGSGGGELSNVNRWRGQMGLAPIDQASMDAIPTMEVLGFDAPFFQLDGAYTGMGGEPRPDWSMLGLILSREQFTIFVKMNGPTDLINAERQNFIAFCASLREPGTVNPPPAQAGATEKGFVLPDGWRIGPEKSMRTLNLLAGESSECYLILLGGEAGGLGPNINRWMGEVGLDPLTDTEIAALPTVKLFGVDSPLLEVSGDYKGMGGNDGADSTVLGVALVRPSGSAFVKMVGPSTEVAAEKQRFIELVESLEE
ncbi:MAG: hypothetical protein GY747_00660 [Planctomycetes bacterium]|nr:hypothetical protein [Planctomycetota bacterium]MCP4770820.1 hypothetical protein [Planctomycetota bacterium]